MKSTYQAAAVLACLAGLSACTTVSSSADNQFHTQPAGIAYLMPMRLAKLTITSTPIDLEEMIKDRDAKIVARATAQAAAASAKTKLEQAQAALVAAAAANRADLTKALEAAAEAEDKARKAADDAVKLVDTLTRGIFDAKMSGDTCAYAPSVEMLPVQGDRRMRYLLQPQHNELRDDTFKIGLTPSGLLTTADITSVDQTGQIIVDLGGIGGAVAGLGKSADGPGKSGDDAKAAGCDKPAVWAAIVDPAEADAIAGLNRQLEDADMPFYVTTQVDGPAQTRTRIADSALPAAEATEGIFYRSATPLLLTLYRSVSPPHDPSHNQDGAGGVRTNPLPIELEHHDATHDAVAPTIGAVPAQAEGTVVSPPPATIPPIAAAESGAPRGAVRPVSTYNVPVLAAVLLVPQAGPVSRLSLQASPFVRSNTTAVFTDGALTSVSSERPGAVPALVKVPLLALDAFAGSFAKAVALRVDIRTTRVAQSTADMNGVILDRLGAALMSCLDTAEQDLAKIQACATAYQTALTPSS